MNQLFAIHPLGVFLGSAIFALGGIIVSFSMRYLKGDTRYRSFFISLITLITFLLSMSFADHLVVMFISLCAANLLISSLVIHKRSWKAARASGILMVSYFLAALLLIGGGLFFLYLGTGETLMTKILSTPDVNGPIVSGLVLLMGGTLIQSAVVPFHRWLLSSLNAPTPVSALMHAGIVNGGGFLIIRFAPLFLKVPTLLFILFGIGLIAALVATTWKWVQTDIKRMLACSTLAQMGFMFVQCGLGLFASAAAHIVWHGMFKAYLFLNLGNGAKEKRFHQKLPLTPSALFVAFLLGSLGCMCFGIVSQMTFSFANTSIFLFIIAWIQSSHLSLQSLEKGLSLKRIVQSGGLSLFAGAFYGAAVLLFEKLLHGLVSYFDQPLNGVYILGGIVILVSWILSLALPNYFQMENPPKFILWIYTKCLNGSQPHKKTVTAHRYHYDYQ